MSPCAYGHGLLLLRTAPHVNVKLIEIVTDVHHLSCALEQGNLWC